MKLKLLILASLFLLAPSVVQANELFDIGVEQNVIQEKVDNLPIYNFGQVSKTIWRGSAPSKRGLSQLAAHGVRTVIDLRINGKASEHERQMASKLGLQYVHLPMGFKKPSYKDMTTFLSIVTNPANLPVYIHCRQGADRTGVMIGVYRVLFQNWTFDKTYDEMRAHHFKPWLAHMKKSVEEIASSDAAKKTLQDSLQTTVALEPEDAI